MCLYPYGIAWFCWCYRLEHFPVSKEYLTSEFNVVGLLKLRSRSSRSSYTSLTRNHSPTRLMLTFLHARLLPRPSLKPFILSYFCTFSRSVFAVICFLSPQNSRRKDVNRPPFEAPVPFRLAPINAYVCCSLYTFRAILTTQFKILGSCRSFPMRVLQIFVYQTSRTS